MNDDEIVLVDRYRDADLTVEERRALDGRLRTDARFRDDFAAELRLHGQIALVLSSAGQAQGFRQRLMERIAASSPDAAEGAPPLVSQTAWPARPAATGAQGRRQPPRLTPRPSRPWQRPAPALLAATVLAAAAAICIWMQVSGRPPAPAPAPTVTVTVLGKILATISETSGSALLTSAGQPPRAAVAGTAVHPDDRLTTPADGQATLRLADGSSIAVAANAELTIADDRGAMRLSLVHGALTAAVARQPPALAMTFLTPQAIATVLGTRLTLSVDSLTRLAVAEGRVALAPREALAAAVTLSAGQSAQATAVSVVMDSARGPAPDLLWIQAVAAAVEPTAQERAWEGMPWRTELWAARREARSAHKPLLLWVGQGHPLGMAYSDCLIDRAVAWADPAIRGQVSEVFIPVALDGWFLSRRRDAVGRFFAAIVAQAQVTRPNTITQGIYCVSCDGALLSQCSCGSDPERVRQVLSDAVRSFATVPAPEPIPDPGPSDALHDPQLPAGAMVLIASARHLIQDAGAYRPTSDPARPASGACGREYLWLSAAERQELEAAAQQVAGTLSVPDPLSRKLVRFGLLDTTQGEATPWEPGDIVSLTLALSADPDGGGPRRLRLAGHVRLASPTRSYEAQLGGHLDYDRVHGAISAFALCALGSHRGEEVTEVDAAGSLLGIELALAPRVLPGVVPHGLRDGGYYLTPVP